MNSVSKMHWVNVLVPVADRWNNGPATDIVEAAGEGVLFLIQCGAGAGATLITAEACDDTTPTTNTDIPFIYRSMTTAPDTWGDWTVGVSGTGFNTSTTENLAYQVWCDAADIGALGFGYVRLQTTESTDVSLVAGIMAAVTNTRYAIQPSSLVD